MLHEVKFNSFNKRDTVYGWVYVPAAQPKGIVQLIHGMEEHQERYEPFVSFLNENGYTVVTSNMRGHGDDAPTLGYFAPKNGYKYLEVTRRAIEEDL